MPRVLSFGLICLLIGPIFFSNVLRCKRRYLIYYAFESVFISNVFSRSIITYQLLSVFPNNNIRVCLTVILGNSFNLSNT